MPTNPWGEPLEIERKFLVSSLPEDLEKYPHSELIQAYINASPVIRIRKDRDRCELTVKGSGLLSHEELNLPLTEEAYLHLLEKHEGKVIEKTRYRIPFGDLTIELDLFHGFLEGKILAEVEFPDEDAALSFIPPGWFKEDVTYDPAWHNAVMAYS